jgi:hypothetical protein
LAEPPPIVNKKSTVSEKYLFINSGLKANNEEKELFSEYSVIDVYSVEDGKYQFSFYLPKHRGIKTNKFQSS